ncbi:MAG: hypothetical protein V4486_00980 [Patescibacteria group bacterium]
MDIKDLNKPQLILLAILLSFVTSIATGIVTVTLMQQAPPSVTAPINRVVQQTVEKIQQVEGKTTVNTVVVKEEDLVVDAIAKNQSTVFSIARSVDGVEVPAGRGFVVSNNDVIVADAVLAGEKDQYFVTNPSGKFKATFIVADPAGFSFLKIGEAVDGTSKLAYTLPAIGDLSKMKIGQKVIVLGNSITSIIYQGDKNISIPLSKGNGGGLVLNLEGEALGIALFNEISPFVSIDVINASLKELPQ